jgi:hypothetical protein
MRRTTAKLLRTRRPPHELFLVREGTTSRSARHVSMLGKKIRAEDCVPSTLLPAGRRPAFAVPAKSGTVVVGHPPKNWVDDAGRQRRTSASSTHSCRPVPLLYEDNIHGRPKTTAVLPPWLCVATPCPR